MPQPDVPPRRRESSWQYRKFSVVTDRYDRADRIAAAGCAGGTRACGAPAPRSRRGDAETADAALGGVELGAGAGHRDPQRRMRLLHGLRQDVALGHREAVPVPREALLRPHLRQHAHVLVPRLLGRRRVRRRSRRARSTSTSARCRTRGGHPRGCRARRRARRRASGGSSPARTRPRRARRGCATSAHRARGQERPRAPSSANTPRGSGARPPTRQSNPSSSAQTQPARARCW